MKHVLLSLFFALHFTLILYSQELKLNSRIEYATIFKSELIIHQTNYDSIHYLKIYNTEKSVKYPKIAHSIHSNIWRIIDKSTVSIAYNEFITNILPVLDSIEYYKQARRYYDSIRRVINDDEKYIDFTLSEIDQKIMQQNRRLVIPAYRLGEIYDHINLRLFKRNIKELLMPPSINDFIVVSSDSIHYFYRNDRLLTIWAYHYPKLGQIGQPNDWQELYTLTYDTTIINKNKFLYKLPLYKKVNYNSISDSSFLDGDLRFIRQDNNYFAINQKHGKIYYVSNEGVYTIGQIDIDNYELMIYNKKVFIEDLDNKIIIFFASVVWENNIYPKPNIEVIKNDDDIERVLGKGVKHLISQ